MNRRLALPAHVGLIPDGTRRWARRSKVPLLEAYNLAMTGINNFIEDSVELGVQAVSVFLLSAENLSREAGEIAAVLNAETTFIRDTLPQLADLHQIRVKHAGRKDLLPSEMSEAIRNLESYSEQFSASRLYLLAAYNPLDEIRLSAENNLSAEKVITQFWVPELVDLVIRTGGDSRLSNFLPIQCGYAEIIIVDKLFNDTERQELRSYIQAFEPQRRRFGI
jgi:undecaprenyl diphosphate synthase